MIWYRLVFLLLLPLGLGGCWERSTSLSSSLGPSSTLDRPTSPAGDEVPTPRFFQLDYSTGE